MPPLAADAAGAVAAAVIGPLVAGAMVAAEDVGAIVAAGAAVAADALGAARVGATVGAAALAALAVGAVVGADALAILAVGAVVGAAAAALVGTLVGAVVAVVLELPPHAASMPSANRATRARRRYRIRFPFIVIISTKIHHGSRCLSSIRSASPRRMHCQGATGMRTSACEGACVR